MPSRISGALRALLDRDERGQQREGERRQPERAPGVQPYSCALTIA